MTEQITMTRYRQLVAKTWRDPASNERLLANAAGTLRREGFDVPAGKMVRLLEPSATQVFVTLTNDAPISAGPVA